MTRAEMPPDEADALLADLMPGSAQPGGGSDDAQSGDVAACLWVPDPEQRHGWREFYVRKQREPKPGRPLGFKQGG